MKNRVSILFLCTANSCRSQMAEGWAKRLFHESPLAQYHHYDVASAGIYAKGVDPRAVEVMAEAGIDISKQQSATFTDQDLERADWIITLCNQVKEYCVPVARRSNQRHWELVDPVDSDANPDRGLACFRKVSERIRILVNGLVAELETLDELERCRFSREDLAILDCSTEYRGFFEIQQLQLKHRLYEGGWTEAFTRELFVRGMAVVVMLYDPVLDRVVLIEQFRIGALADQRSPWLLEMVAGIVEPGESPEQVAHREAMEEAGCEISDLVKLYDYWTSPGGSDERVVIYCARVDAANIGGVHGLDHEHEDICVKVVASDWAFEAVRNGIINNAATIMALQWLQLNKHSLNARWLSNK